MNKSGSRSDVITPLQYANHSYTGNNPVIVILPVKHAYSKDDLRIISILVVILYMSNITLKARKQLQRRGYQIEERLYFMDWNISGLYCTQFGVFVSKLVKIAILHENE